MAVDEFLFVVRWPGTEDGVATRLKRTTLRMQLACLLVLCDIIGSRATSSQDAVRLTIEAGRPAAKCSPILYGLMTEEINHSYDGGLYAELLRNRAFMDDSQRPANRTVVQGSG